MTALVGGSGANTHTTVPPAAAGGTVVRDVPVRSPGTQLLGVQPGSGYVVPPALVRRGDGQVLQLTPLLYTVLEAVDGTRSLADVADAVGQTLRRSVAPADIRQLITSQLLPLGLLQRPDGTEPELKRSNPLL